MNYIKKALDLQFKSFHFSFALKYTFLTLLSTAINGYLFGMNYAIPAFIVTAFYFIIPNRNIPLGPISTFNYLYIHLVVSVFLGFLASTNPLLSLIINGCIPFCIVMIFTSEKNQIGYLYYYALFIIVQIMGLTFQTFPIHLATSFIGLLIPYLYDEVTSEKKHDHVTKETFLFFLRKNIYRYYDRIHSQLNVQLSVTRFAVRLGVATSSLFFVCAYIPNPKWYWIVIAACFTLVPMQIESNMRGFKRIIGTIIGGFLFVICSFFVKDLMVAIPFIIVSLFFTLAYIPTGRVAESVTFSTFLALSITVFTVTSIHILATRLLFVFIGVIVAILFNHFLLPNKLPFQTDVK